MGRDPFHGDIRMYLFIPPPLHSHSAAFGDAAVRPAAQLPMGLICLSEEIAICSSFPLFRTLPRHNIPLASPHPSEAHGRREQGARGPGAAVLGSLCMREDAAKAPGAAARNRLKITQAGYRHHLPLCLVMFEPVPAPPPSTGLTVGPGLGGSFSCPISVMA